MVTHVRLKHLSHAAAVLLCIAALHANAQEGTDAPSPERTRFSLSLGAGHSHGILGPHLELRRGPWAGFATGMYFQQMTIAGGGLRYYLWNGGGPFFSVHGTQLWAHPSSSRLVTLAATLGFRLRGKHLFAELAVGPAVGFYTTNYFVDSGRQVRITRVWPGAFAALEEYGTWMPDITLAMGWEF
jgi:hypothetical protein